MSEPRYLYAGDLSLDCTGLAIFNLDTFEPVFITSFPMKPDASKQTKLRSLEVEILKLQKKYPPFEIAVEGVFISTVSKNQFAMANRFKAAEALFNIHGLIYTRFWNVPLYTYQPKTIKMIVGGHGDCSKDKVKASIKKKYPHIKFNNNDESDAVGIAIVHMSKEHGFEWERPVVTSEDVKPRKKTAKNSTKQSKPKTK